MKTLWFIASGVSAAASIAPFSVGIRRLNYSGSKYIDAFVGGDAYNFIINSSQSTSCFVLFGVCILAMFGFLIAGYLVGIYEIQRQCIANTKELVAMGDSAPKGQDNVAETPKAPIENGGNNA